MVDDSGRGRSKVRKDIFNMQIQGQLQIIRSFACSKHNQRQE